MVRTSGIILFFASALLTANDWPQFRGPNASGVSEEVNLPVSFGPEENVVWKTPVPMGNSSPVIAGDKVFLTGFEGERLITIALHGATGRFLWQKEAPRPRKQVIERPANGPASASPVSDGRNVYVFFQDFGLLAYGPDGNELWRMPLGPFNNPFGHGASPILAGDTLLMNVDQDAGSFLLAVEKNSGRVKAVLCGHAHRNSQFFLGGIPVLIRVGNVSSPFGYTLVHLYPDGRAVIVQKSQHFPFEDFISQGMQAGAQGAETDRYLTLAGS